MIDLIQSIFFLDSSVSRCKIVIDISKQLKNTF